MDVVTKLQFEVFLKGEYVIKAGTLGQKMYFVQSGVVDVLTEDGELMTSLSDGSHFGGLCVCVHVCTIYNFWVYYQINPNASNSSYMFCC